MLTATTQFLRGVKTSGVQVRFGWVMAFDLTEFAWVMLMSFELTELGSGAVTTPSTSQQSQELLLLWALKIHPTISKLCTPLMKIQSNFIEHTY